MSVLFPLPFRPMTAKCSPSCNSKLMGVANLRFMSPATPLTKEIIVRITVVSVDCRCKSNRYASKMFLPMPFCVEKVRKRKSPAAIPSANQEFPKPGRNSGKGLPGAVLHKYLSICVPVAQKEPSVRVWRQYIARPCPACRDRISR